MVGFYVTRLIETSNPIFRKAVFLMAEYWDLLDKNRNPIGKLHRRGQPFHDGEYHTVVEIMTIAANEKILVTKRHPSKHFGNTWEFTAGSVLASEASRAGAKRELLEETGIDIPEDSLIYLATFTSYHQFYDEYLVLLPEEPKQLTLQPSEVCDAKFVTLKELKEMNQRGEFVSPAYRRIIQHPHLYARFLKNGG